MKVSDSVLSFLDCEVLKRRVVEQGDQAGGGGGRLSSAIRGVFLCY